VIELTAKENEKNDDFLIKKTVLFAKKNITLSHKLK
jgi:hypothetical protein